MLIKTTVLCDQCQYQAFVTGIAFQPMLIKHLEDYAASLKWMVTNDIPPKFICPKCDKEDKLIFDPATGSSNPYPDNATLWRKHHGQVAWLYNPYTGMPRDPRDIGYDTFGHLLVKSL